MEIEHLFRIRPVRVQIADQLAHLLRKLFLLPADRSPRTAVCDPDRTDGAVFFSGRVIECGADIKVFRIGIQRFIIPLRQLRKVQPVLPDIDRRCHAAPSVPEPFLNCFRCRFKGRSRNRSAADRRGQQNCCGTKISMMLHIGRLLLIRRKNICLYIYYSIKNA